MVSFYWSMSSANMEHCDREICTNQRVGIVPDTFLSVSGPRTHGKVGVVLGATNTCSQEVLRTKI